MPPLTTLMPATLSWKVLPVLKVGSGRPVAALYWVMATPAPVPIASTPAPLKASALMLELPPSEVTTTPSPGLRMLGPSQLSSSAPSALHLATLHELSTQDVDCPPA